MNVTLGNLLAQERVAAGMSLYALSEETGLSAAHLARIERDDAPEINQRELYLLHKALGIEMKTLFCAAELAAHPFLQMTPYCQYRFMQVLEALEQTLDGRPCVFEIATNMEATTPEAETLFLDGSCALYIANCRKSLRLKLPSYEGGSQYIAGESTSQERFLIGNITFMSLLRVVQWLDAR